ncbi:hypothetical protein BJX70DRAFT_376595 [Aspergillus crustosus]
MHLSGTDTRLKMSGIELVGVVLGAIPLILSAIESYKKTSQRCKYFRYKEPYIIALVHSLEDQRFFLETDEQWSGASRFSPKLHQASGDCHQNHRSRGLVTSHKSHNGVYTFSKKIQT